MLIWTQNPIKSLARQDYEEAKTPIINYLLRPTKAWSTYGKHKWILRTLTDHDPLLTSCDKETLKEFAQKDFDRRMSQSERFKS